MRRLAILILLALFAPSVLEGQTVVQFAGGSCNNCATLQQYFTFAVTATDALLVSCSTRGPLNGAPAFTDFLGNTYTIKSAGAAQGAGQYTFQNLAWACGSGGGNPVAVTCDATIHSGPGAGLNENSIIMTIQEVSGIPSPCIVNALNTGCVGGCGSVLTTASLVTGSATTFIEAMGWEESSNNSSAPSSSPFTFRTSVYDSGSSPVPVQTFNADKVVSMLSTYNNSFTMQNSTGSWGTWIAAFGAAAGTAHSRRHAQVY